MSFGECLEILYPVADAVINRLNQAAKKPFFDLEGIKEYSWSATRALFDYTVLDYVGIRFVIVLWVF